MGATVWYKHTPANAGLRTPRTTGSNFNTVLAVWQQQGNTIVMIGCSDNNGLAPTSTWTMAVAPGVTYWFQVGGVNGATGNLVFSV